jgi:hypothetical protein
VFPCLCINNNSFSHKRVSVRAEFKVVGHNYLGRPKKEEGGERGGGGGGVSQKV